MMHKARENILRPVSIGDAINTAFEINLFQP